MPVLVIESLEHEVDAVNPEFIVGTGGSAGGLKAYFALLNALPANTRKAFAGNC